MNTSVGSSVKQLADSRTHIEAAEGIEQPVLDIDLFLHISHELSADGENVTLENETK